MLDLFAAPSDPKGVFNNAKNYLGIPDVFTPPKRFIANRSISKSADKGQVVYLRASTVRTRLVPRAVVDNGGFKQAVGITSEKRKLSGDVSVESCSGVWRKDKKSSDSMDEVCGIMELPWIIRKAMGIIDKLEVKCSQTEVQTILKAGVLNVVEKYPLDGQRMQYKRRDLRSGKHTGAAALIDAPEEQGFSITCDWGEPLGGTCTDTFTISQHDGGNTLTNRTEMRLANGKSCSYTTVYKRERS